MRRVAVVVAVAAVVELTAAQWLANSVRPVDWVNAVNRKRCLHNNFQINSSEVAWSDFLYQAAKDAATANAICSSSDISYVYVQNSTAATNPLDSTQVYAGFSFHIEAGVSGRDTAAKVVDAWYSKGLSECSGSSGSGLKLPGCVEDDGGTAAPTAAPTTAGSVVVDDEDSTDDTPDDPQFVFMAMISSATKFVGCYRCSESAADSTAPSYNSLRVICAFKGISDSCPNVSDCSSCHDWEAVACHESTVLAVNPNSTEGDCTVQVEALPVFSLPSNATNNDNDDLSDEAITLIVIAVILLILILIFLFLKWEWIRVHVLGKHSRKYVENKKAAQKANSASVRATMRSVREVQSKRVGSSIRHPATDEIFNPRFGLQESGASGKSTSALDHLDKRFEMKARGQGGDDNRSTLKRRNRGTVKELSGGGGQKYSVVETSDAHVGDASF